MKELKLAWRYVRRHWWQYILGILALFIVDEVNTYVPRFTGEITNIYEGAEDTPIVIKNVASNGNIYDG